MDESSLSHTRWDCKYHVVFAPKFRRKEKSEIVSYNNL
jgi:putative transposase